MSSSITCFLLTPSGRHQLSLRRYASSDIHPCPRGLHDACVTIGETGTEEPTRDATDAERMDPRWPTHCACGYAFRPEDYWQYCCDEFFSRSDGGPATTLSAAPVGAMWDATWWPHGEDRGPDGRSLVLRTPGGDWHVDGPSKGGGHWTRTGEVPRATARPSIVCGGFHGFLTDGVLAPC